MKKLVSLLIISVILISAVYGDIVDDAKKIVAQATETKATWTGPTSGPKIKEGVYIVLVASDLKNGGVVGVVEGVKEAAKEVGWKVDVLDGAGSVKSQVSAFNQSIAKKPNAIGLVGWDPNTIKRPIQKAKRRKIELVSWHASTTPGPIPEYDIFYNISTDASEVAKVAAMYALAQSDGKAKAVIFTDSLYAIAVAKAKDMESVIQSAPNAQVLEYIDTPIADTSNRMPSMTFSLLQKYGDNLEYMLAINDLYFDFTAASLKAAGMSPDGPPYNISAGDGSEAAYQRIRKGGFQAATVPEPLNQQGWQMVDEMNRAMSGVAPSGYVAPVYLVTKDNIDANGGDRNIYDPDNGYRNVYLKIWK